ncbi:MAG: PAS domain-containing protein [Cyclobacteriaceae bacterium]
MIPGRAWKIIILYLIAGILIVEALRYLLLNAFPFGSPLLLYLCAIVVTGTFLTLATKYHFTIISRDETEDGISTQQDKDSAISAYAAIYESNMPFFWIIEDGHFINANNAFCDLFDYTKDEIYSIHPDRLHKDNGYDFRALWELCEKKEKVQLQLEGVRKNGEAFPYDLSAFLIEKDNARLLCGFCQDMSERVKNRQAIEANEKRMKLSMEAANEGSWDWDLAKNRIFYDDRCYKMLGFSPEQLSPIDNIWKALVHPRDKFRVIREMMKHLDEDELFTLEFRMKAHDGTFRWVQCRGKVVEKNLSGKATRVMGTYVDITENKKNEAAALEAAAHLKIAMDANSQALWEYKPGSQEVYYSNQYYELLGYAPGEFPTSTEHAHSMIHPDDILQVENDFQAYLGDSSGNYSSTYRVRCENGNYKWIHSRATFIGDKKGNRRLIGIVIDIHNQKINEMRLKHQNQQLIDYAFFNSHRLRAPLARVMGLTELVKQDIEHPLMGKLLESASELDSVTRDINHILSHDFAAETFNEYTQVQIRNIMLVDDDSVSHFLHERIIKSRKPEVETIAYAKPREALEHLQNGKIKPDVCLLDINMPIISGFDFLDEMKKADINLPVYMLTSSINTEDVRRSKAFKNVRGFITKPLTLETVDKIFNVTEPVTVSSQPKH